MDFTFDPKKHTYYLDGKPLTGVTSVLGVLAKPALIGWAARMTADWIRENCDADINTTEKRGPKYEVYESDLQEAVKAHTKKKEDAADKGKDIHSIIEQHIKWCIENNNGYNCITTEGMGALDRFTEWADRNSVRFLTSETPTYSREWWLAGTPDFTFEKDGKKYVGDLKTYAKIWDIIPHFQCAAYAKMLTEQTGDEYSGTVIVNINKESNELTEQWRYDIAGDRDGFEAALKLYRKLNV